MDSPTYPLTLRPRPMSEQEWALRLELAACYRLFEYNQWVESIFNHITLRVPGGTEDNPHFLINPFGLHFGEVRASNLVKIDLNGEKVDDSPHLVNPAGFVIHSAVHGARHDAHCVMHTHTTAGLAVACKEAGLRHDNFYGALLFGRVAYHDWEGITTDPQECPRLVANLGDNDIMILRNHWLLVVGGDVPSAYQNMFHLQRACEVQLASESMAGPNREISTSILRKIPGQRKLIPEGSRPGLMAFYGMLRRAGIRFEDIV
jgi:ribulose-5-phosphate 4-epimerase/fuculose-1-phosphate aldolase